MISLSNIRYTLNTVLPRIGDALRAQGYPELPTAVGEKSDWTQLVTLDSAVLDAYLERRCDPLVGTIEPSMYLGGLEWDFDIEPNHLKPYAQEILANLIAVHAEVISWIRYISLTYIHIYVCVCVYCIYFFCRCAELRRLYCSEFCLT